MKINNNSKVAMDIFHQARRQIALVAGLLGQFIDVVYWKIGWQIDLLFIGLYLTFSPIFFFARNKNSDK